MTQGHDGAAQGCEAGLDVKDEEVITLSSGQTLVQRCISHGFLEKMGYHNSLVFSEVSIEVHSVATRVNLQLMLICSHCLTQDDFDIRW
ncbi:hypothetical protein J6590_064305 [Homalodisca vitripennis]|nr:hypothetical protein J6590_064305 [Homalodisca vitripennis]